MNLATRCPACGTIFRVVQDQLRVSEGGVRCGQCQEVFQGAEALFELDDKGLAPRDIAPHAQEASSAGDAAGNAEAATPDDRTAEGLADTGPAPHRGISPSFAARVAARMAQEAARVPLPETPHESTVDRGLRAPIDTPAQDPAIHTADDVAEAAEVPFDSTWPMPLADPAEAPAAPPAAPRDTAVGEAIAVDADAPDGSLSESDIVWLEEPARDPLVSAPETAVDSDPLPALAPEAQLPAADETVAISPSGPDGPPAPHEEPAQAARTPSDHDEPSLQGLDEGIADYDAGPQTLAALLPEPIEDWPPPRKRRKRMPQAPEPRIVARQREAAERDSPRFVREARHSGIWHRPAVRAGLAVALVALVASALAQAAYPLRDTIAARWPQSAPAWGTVCDALGCTLQAPRSLASLALDGSSLTRTDTEHVLLFSADLHNRSDHAVRMPSFELSFTDLNGQVVARKVLGPAEIGLPDGPMGPDKELHVHTRLHLEGLEATGFQAEMFYP